MLVLGVLLAWQSHTALAAPRDCTRTACRDEVAVTCTAVEGHAHRDCEKAIRARCRAGACSCAVGDDTGKTGSCACPAGEVCRQAADDCDVAETCDGSSPDCPADAFKPDSSPCYTNQNFNFCGIPGCEAGRCVPTHAFVVTGYPCPDTDGNPCTIAGCFQGNCLQNEVGSSTSRPCADTDGNDCTFAGCEGVLIRQCVQTHLFMPAGTLCSGGTCDGQGHCLASPSGAFLDAFD
jgi:hypothetical protein